MVAFTTNRITLKITLLVFLGLLFSVNEVFVWFLALQIVLVVKICFRSGFVMINTKYFYLFESNKYVIF